MSSLHKPGSHYWTLIEPYWLPLNESWDEGPSTFLARFAEAPIRVQHLYAGHWCQSEVCNGGLHQFFWNTTGILAPEAIAGFRAIGASEWAAILEEAVRLVGTPYPRNRSVRLQVLSQYEHHSPFDSLDDRFYAWSEDDYDRWDRLADDYAK